MTQPISLNKARKARAKTKAKTTATQNRVRFGEPKAVRALRRSGDARAAHDLDGHKRD